MNRRPFPIPFKTALLYALVGGVWIFLSDWMLETFTTDAAPLSSLQTYKGWLFVAVTAFLLYFLLRREFGALERAERTARENERRLLEMLQNLQLIAMMLDMSGRITFCNNYLLNLTGWRREDVLHKDWFQTFIPESKESVRSTFFETLAAGKIPPHYQNPIRTKSGELREILWNNTMLRDAAGALIGTASIGEDITERMRGEEAKKNLEAQLQQAQKLESLGRLASGIAHDFNNILGIIIGHSSLLEQLPPSPDNIKRNTGAITKAGQRGAALVKQMLTFARKTDVVFESLRINEIVEEVVSLVRETFPKSITLAVHFEKDLPPIEADATQLHQVLLNLCVNARDAMPDGGTLTISTHRSSGRELSPLFPEANAMEYVGFALSDTGNGMDKVTQERIFEPFFTTKERGKGTGLGLSLVFGIMKSHGGFIDLRTEPGKGATFSCYFPVQPDLRSNNEGTVGTAEAVPGGTETILLVEDEESLRELIGGLLQSKGYTVLKAADGPEALKLYLQHRGVIRLVLSDMGLPGLNGHELYSQLKELDPGLCMIFASGSTEPGLKGQLLAEGVRDFIPKPYHPHELLLAVRKALENDSKSGALEQKGGPRTDA